MGTKTTAAKTANKDTEQAVTPAANEVQCKIEVLAQESGDLVEIGSMRCGGGARGVLPKSKALELVELGFVKILGTA
jgi:hypothetical protein